MPSSNPAQRFEHTNEELNRQLDIDSDSHDCDANIFVHMEADNASNEDRTGKQICCQNLQNTAAETLSSLQSHALKIHFNELLYLISTTAKIYSYCLLNSSGQIVYANKLASEHFEGSLTSFNTNKFTQFVLSNHRQTLIRQLNATMGSNKWVNYVIYSKSAKRKYAMAEDVREYDECDIYFRYLKAMKSIIYPVQCCFTGKLKDEGFRNPSLCVESDVQYLLKSCYSETFPNLRLDMLLGDEKIRKFIKATHFKKLKKCDDNAFADNLSESERKWFAHKRSESVQRKNRMVKNLRKIKQRELHSVLSVCLPIEIMSEARKAKKIHKGVNSVKRQGISQIPKLRDQILHRINSFRLKRKQQQHSLSTEKSSAKPQLDEKRGMQQFDEIYEESV